VAEAREVAIVPVVCCIRHGAATLDDALRDMAGASSSLCTIESEMYSLMGGASVACTSATSRTL
jgi:hypothetical protein